MSEGLPDFQRLGREPATGREVYLLPLRDLSDLPSVFVPSGGRFVLLLLADFSESVKDLGALARRLVDSGCAYFCAWGPGCELMHDEVDDAAPMLDDADSVLMTTWHADDSIEDAVYFAVERTTPAGVYETGCNTTILAVQNRNGWLLEAEAAARELLPKHAI